MVDWDLLKAVRAGMLAGKDISNDVIERLCRTVEEQDKVIGQKTQEYASLWQQNATLHEQSENHATLNATLLAKIESLGDVKPAPAAEGEGDGA